MQEILAPGIRVQCEASVTVEQIRGFTRGRVRGHAVSPIPYDSRCLALQEPDPRGEAGPTHRLRAPLIHSSVGEWSRWRRAFSLVVQWREMKGVVGERALRDATYRGSSHR